MIGVAREPCIAELRVQIAMRPKSRNYTNADHTVSPEAPIVRCIGLFNPPSATGKRGQVVFAVDLEKIHKAFLLVRDFRDKQSLSWRTNSYSVEKNAYIRIIVPDLKISKTIEAVDTSPDGMLR